TEGDGQFLVMEYIRGEDLSSILEMHGQRYVKPIPQGDALRWADQLLGVLEYMHSQRPPVIHRDIKPKNLKLNERGEIILLDFGLAKEEAMESALATGSVRGYTLKYAPLEQIQGTGTDPRSDIYSLAATFYHIMTGHEPLDALTRATTLIEGRPDPLRRADELNPQVSPKVSSLLEQAMAMDRNRRPATASAMRAALREIASVQTPPQPETEVITKTRIINEDQATRPVPETPLPLLDAKFSDLKKRRAWLWIAGAAIVLIVGIIAWQVNRGKTNTAGTRGRVTNPTPDAGDIVRLTSRELIDSGSEEERYYSFESGAGELTLTLDVIGSGSIVKVEAIDEQKALLWFDRDRTNMSMVSSGEHEQKISSLIVGREQTVLLRVNTSNPKGLQAFRLRIDGPAKLKQGVNSGIGKHALAALFENRDRPMPLTSNTVLVGQEQKKESYYVFTAGPGEVKLTLNLIGSGATVSVEFFNDRAELLKFGNSSDNFKVASINLNEEGRAQLLLSRNQRLLMRIHNTYPVNTQALRLKIDGPVQLAQADEAGSSAGTNDAVMRYFAARDNPEQLQSREISNRISEKEKYFTFRAGPGPVRVTVEAEGGGTTTKVEFFDSASKHIRFAGNDNSLSLTSINKKEKKSDQITLGREEMLLMRLTTNYPEMLKNFHLRLDGSVKKM
ncbi:MAG: serine/threonine protein kinase, partial [Acidobacteria bacterium]|nr:serine/threonine protein kinase [Acidobacteriota bacterium]